MSTTHGIQGQTNIVSNLQRTEAFMTEVLGLRVTKRTVHPHDERIATMEIGFGAGSTQRLTFVEWNPIFYAFPPEGLVGSAATTAALDRPRVGDFKGRWGAGTNHHVALHVASREGLLKWKRRLRDHGVHVTGPYFRNYFNAIYFREPDGALFEIATTEPGFGYDEEVLGSTHQAPKAGAMVGSRSETEVAAEAWPEPVPAVTDDMRLLGLHHITSVSSDIDRTTAFWTEAVGLQLIKRTDYLDQEGGTHYYFAATDEVQPGHVLTYFGFPGFEPGRLGVGLSHHFTLTVPDDDALATLSKRLRAGGVDTADVEDLGDARGLLFRDPDGHLCQFATPIDADAGGEPNGRLVLPERLEPRREAIERGLRLRPAPTPAS
jgi:catechol 2,3-dioxygenase-like lactoylglutathione lyase family enzyme